MSGRAPLAALAVSGFLVSSALVYAAAYASVPSDGTVIDIRQAPPRAGLVATVIDPAGELQTGDLVTGVNGQPVDEWLVERLRRPWDTPPADALTYTVERGGRSLTVPARLQAPPVGAILRQNWTTYLAILYFELVALIVFIRRPTLPIAQMLLVFVSSLFGSSLIYFLGLPVSSLRLGWLAWMWLWGTIGIYGLLAGNALMFAMVFPRVWPPLRGRLNWAALVYAGVWLPLLVHLAAGWPSQSGASGQILLGLRATNSISVIVFPLAVVASFTGYHWNDSEAERRQVRWVVWGLLVAIGPWVVLDALPQALGLSPLLPPLLVGLLWCTLPTAFAIAVLREGLFDIDVLINRSLVYGLLTAVLALAYFGGVVVLQNVFRTVTGALRSELATVLSTLGIAALFSPLRRRLQSTVDRRFYRRKYDAARTLAAFGANVRDEVDLNVLAQRLVTAVDSTMQPAQTWLWLRPVPGEQDGAGASRDR